MLEMELDLACYRLKALIRNPYAVERWHRRQDAWDLKWKELAKRRAS